MASAYKSLNKDGLEGSATMEDKEMDESDESSATLEAATEPLPSSHGISGIPLEIKNRVLMLTTRGVSHRYLWRLSRYPAH